MAYGTRCPNCNSGLNRVVKTYDDSTVVVRGKRITVVKRRRSCEHCGTGWFTYERNEEDIIHEEESPPPAPPPDATDDNPFI